MAINIFPFSIKGVMYLKKNVNNNVLICEPSTSASVMIIILLYLSFDKSIPSLPVSFKFSELSFSSSFKVLPNPLPIAVIIC